MKKFKVIEEGRLLTTEELKKLKGSGCISPYVGCGTYDNCGIVGGYITCRPASTYGYESSCSDLKGHTTCGQGQRYVSCVRSYLVCGGDRLYC